MTINTLTSMAYLARAARLASLLLCCSTAAVGSGFEFLNDDDAVSLDGGDQNTESPLDNDVEQYELRVARSTGVGIGFGEIVPQEDVSLQGIHILDDHRALGFSIGEGRFKATGLSNAQESYSNKVRDIVADGSFYWWPSRTFPFVMSAGMSLTASDGTITMSSGSAGHYKVYAAAIGAGLGMQTIFENGIWLHWQLLSGRYGHCLAGSYSQMSDGEIESVRLERNKFKMVGVANIILGYAW
jgi:hypothetical protein